jgi:hypothetical protein
MSLATCSATTAKGGPCKNPGTGTAGDYAYCRIGSHRRQAVTRSGDARRSRANIIDSSPPPASTPALSPAARAATGGATSSADVFAAAAASGPQALIGADPPLGQRFAVEHLKIGDQQISLDAVRGAILRHSGGHYTVSVQLSTPQRCGTGTAEVLLRGPDGDVGHWTAPIESAKIDLAGRLFGFSFRAI